MIMRDIETMFRQTDFSKDTDLKERLAKRLFASKSSNKITQFPFQRLSDNDVELVNAAQGLYPDPKDEKH